AGQREPRRAVGREAPGVAHPGPHGPRLAGPLCVVASAGGYGIITEPRRPVACSTGQTPTTLFPPRTLPMRRRLPLSLLALSLALSLSAAADWPRFRGPNGTGTADGPLPPINPKAPAWKVEIPGRGAGSPIVVKDKIFLQTASEDGS